MKHVTGPWCVKAGQDGDWYVNGLAGEVCRVWGERHGTREANARLIAAAPDLLEACMDLIAWEERAEDRECRVAIGEAIRAAIARATGEKP
jgi:hypothetical protein